jgi:hypothetical protein
MNRSRSHNKGLRLSANRIGQKSADAQKPIDSVGKSITELESIPFDAEGYLYALNRSDFVTVYRIGGKAKAMAFGPP